MENKIRPLINSTSKRQILQRKSTLVEDMEENVGCADQIIMKESLRLNIAFSKELININVSINYMSNQTLLSDDLVYIFTSTQISLSLTHKKIQRCVG